jgi:hypothetical protein
VNKLFSLIYINRDANHIGIMDSFQGPYLFATRHDALQHLALYVLTQIDSGCRNVELVNFCGTLRFHPSPSDVRKSIYSGDAAESLLDSFCNWFFGSIASDTIEAGYSIQAKIIEFSSGLTERERFINQLFNGSCCVIVNQAIENDLRAASTYGERYFAASKPDERVYNHNPSGLTFTKGQLDSAKSIGDGSWQVGDSIFQFQQPVTIHFN